MLLKNLLLALLLFFCMYANAFKSNEKKEYLKGVFVDYDIVEDGDVTKSTFKVMTEEKGNYFLNFWILGSKSIDGVMKHFPIRINGVEVDNVVSKTSNWHSYHSLKSFSFKEGVNIVEIFDVAPHVANVKNMFLSKDSVKNNTADEIDCTNYVNSLKSKNVVNQKQPPLLYNKTFNVYSGETTKFPLDASCIIGYKAKYTFSQLVSCREGETLFISSSLHSGGRYVVDVYSYDNPSDFSITFDDFTTCLTKFISVPHKGFYVVRLRGIENDGTCDLLLNNETYEDIPFAYVDLSLPIYSYENNILFVGNNIDIIPSLSVQDVNNKLIGLGTYRVSGVRYLNMNDYENIGNISIYSDSPIRPYDQVDVYFNAKQLENKRLISEFNLNGVMIPVSAPQTFDYNCFAWSVGIWDHWEDPTDDFLTGHLVNNEDYPEEFYYDDFYYCNGYERCERDDEAVICVWGFKEGQDSVFVHASVRKYLNSDTIPHGFDWESKMGANVRMYHTSDDIMQDKYKSGYGIPLAYYKPNSSYARKSILEKVADDKLILLSSQLEKANIDFLKFNIKLINNTIINEFNRLYEIWKGDVSNSVYSTFRDLRHLSSYEVLKAYVDEHPSLHFVIMQALSSDDQFALPLIEDVILPNNKDIYEEVAAKLRRIKKENQRVNIYSSTLVNAKMFLDILLTKKYNTSKSSLEKDAKTTFNNKSKLFVNCEGNVCKINANINGDYSTTCKIFTIHGELITTIVSCAELQNGINVFSYVLPQKGTYLISLENGNNINVKKVIVK